MGAKQDLLKAAVKLFASQGFDATTTSEIAILAGVTEPVIYYHFKSKDGLFSYILNETFDEYFKRLDALAKRHFTQFKKIENLINLHFNFLDDFPDETYIIISACPAKLKNTAHICAQQIEKQRTYLNKYISNCLRLGIKKGEFRSVQVQATTGLLIALVNGLLRRRSLKIDQIKGLKKTTIEFCRRNLAAAFSKSCFAPMGK